MKSYTILAKYYDRLMGDFDYNGYFANIENLVSGEGVDLCCGSGKIAIALAKKGKKMIGVDISMDMLNVANTNSKKAGQNILFINQDILEFQPPHKLDFACCVCDGLNYIKSQDLENLFAKINGYIKDGGFFIFDISTLYKLKNILGDNIFCEDYDDLTYIWSNSYNKKENSLDMQISFFEKKHNNDYVRIDENHLQYAHSEKIIKDSLEKLWNFTTLDGETYKTLDKNSKRAIYICQKK